MLGFVVIRRREGRYGTKMSMGVDVFWVVGIGFVFSCKVDEYFI